ETGTRTGRRASPEGNGVQAIQLIGFGSFMVASGVLGVRLLRLGLRTREGAELVLGSAFLLSGCLGWGGFSAMPLLRAQGAAAETVRTCYGAGLGCTLVGALAMGVGVALIFWSGARWPWPVLAGLAALQVLAFALLQAAPTGRESPGFCLGLATAAILYGWAGVESWLLGEALRRRARLGLADPLVANRALLWAVASAASVVLILPSVVNRMLPVPVDTVALRYFQSACGLV